MNIYTYIIFSFTLLIACNGIKENKQMNSDRLFSTSMGNNKLNHSLIKEENNYGSITIVIEYEKNFDNIIDEIKILLTNTSEELKYKKIKKLTKQLLNISYKKQIKEDLNSLFFYYDFKEKDKHSEISYNDLSNEILKYIYPLDSYYQDENFILLIDKLIDYFFLNNNSFLALSLSKEFKSKSVTRFFAKDTFFPLNKTNMTLMNCLSGCFYHIFCCLNEIFPCFKKKISDIWICCNLCTKCCIIFCWLLFVIIIGLICFGGHILGGGYTSSGNYDF